MLPYSASKWKPHPGNNFSLHSKIVSKLYKVLIALLNILINKNKTLKCVK